jgi:hypothetical protein
MNDIIYKESLQCLSEWIPYSRKQFYRQPDREELACYGTGFDEWGIQTNQKAFSAYAILATDPNTDIKITRLSRRQLLEDAKALLRFCLYTHYEGDYLCNDNKHWGHTWLTSVGTERMMHGIEAIWDELTEQDKSQLRRVQLSEADWLLDNYPVLAGLVENNRPESNIWNGAVLQRAALMYPDAPRATEYQKKALHFFVNGISLDYDAASEKKYDGKKVLELYEGDNFFRSFALDHHRYMNMGYIVIALSHIAMLHYAYKNKGLPAPEALYHHAIDAWELVKLCTFPDGRLLRVGGDNRVRYCYCQDYLLPVWFFMREHFGNEACEGWEHGWLEMIKTEMRANGDGSFLSARCGALDEISPLYYTRLEADRACSLSLGIYWRRKYGEQETPCPSGCLTTGEWADDYHGACLVKSEKRIASWVWRAAELPTGLCLPTSESNLAEWRENLGGQLRGYGMHNYQTLVTHQEHTFHGGFVTSGMTAAISDLFAAEGQHSEIFAYNDIACAALPDDASMVVLQHARAATRSYLTAQKGLYLNIPNDVFNGCQRSYYTENGSIQLTGADGHDELICLKSRWVNVDDKLSTALIYGAGELVINHPQKRQIGIKREVIEDGEGSGDIGMLFCDEICADFREGRWVEDRGKTLFDLGFIVRVNTTHEQTAHYIAENNVAPVIFPGKMQLRGVVVIGADGIRYALLANFGETISIISFEEDISKNSLKINSNGAYTCILPGKTAVLLSQAAGWREI